MNFEQARIKMVDNQIRPASVTDHALISAMLEVPREAFFAPQDAGLAYVDRHYRLDSATRSQRFLPSPAIVARLVQLSMPGPNDVALVIGAGGGYTAAVFSHLVSSVVAIESDDGLFEGAEKVLADIGRDNIVLLKEAPQDGLEREAPYDVIFVEGSVGYCPESWKEQLAEGGRLVLVLGHGNAARAHVFTKRGGIVGSTAEFNCAMPALPGFEKEPEFAL